MAILPSRSLLSLPGGGQVNNSPRFGVIWRFLSWQLETRGMASDVIVTSAGPPSSD